MNAVAPGDPGSAGGYVPPPYPYDLLDESRAVAAGLPGGAVDLSIGTPCGPVATVVAEVLGEAVSYSASRPRSPGWARGLFGVLVIVIDCFGKLSGVPTHGPHGVWG